MFVKRDDLLQPIAGNKARKLKYNYVRFLRGDYDCIVTFGGPFSNHIYATASLGKHFPVRVVGGVRGEVDDPHNPVLRHARESGMQLIAIDRKTYGLRYNKDVIERLKIDGRPYVIPEGGANREGIRGCGEIVEESIGQLGTRPRYWVTPAGTGSTACGIASMLQGDEKVFAIAALREKIMVAATNRSMGMISHEASSRVTWVYDYHLGGLAKYDDRLLGVMRRFKQQYGFRLDPIYTAKAFLGLVEMIMAGEFEPGSDIIFVHTGGHPGRMAFEYRYDVDLGQA